MSETTDQNTTLEPDTLDTYSRGAYDLLVEICQASGLDCRAEVRSVEPPYIHIDLVGEDVALTFGRMGQSLDALQLLANAIMAHRVDADIRISLDGAGYRARRAESLIAMARELAEEVKERNEEAELDPLPPHERRIIHAALVDDEEITTYSEGFGSDRRIIISPRKPAE